MTEDVPAPAQAKAARKKKVAAPKKKDGPSLPKLIAAIVTESGDRKGLSTSAIKKILTSKGVDMAKTNKRINVTISRMVKNGALIRNTGTGASGSFRVPRAEPVKKAAKVKKSPAKPKKPVAKKPVAKKAVAKKPAAKKPVVKSTAAKKTAAKKAAKSPAKKKPVKKPAKKPVERKAVKAATKKAVKKPAKKTAAAKKAKK